MPNTKHCFRHQVKPSPSFCALCEAIAMADGKTEKARKILRFADVADLLPDSDKSDKSNKSDSPNARAREATSFQILKDGRIVEQIQTNFASHDPEIGEHCVLDSIVNAEGITYKPIDDELFQKSYGAQFADRKKRRLLSSRAA